MKPIMQLLFMSLITILSACSSSVKFPASSLTPSADIQAEVQQDRMGNYDVSVTAKYMNAPYSLDPPRNAYVVWIVTEKDGVKNIGWLTDKNLLFKRLRTKSLKASTPYKIHEIFITAENQNFVDIPSGFEVSRVRIE